jgi:hypothetical protein
MASSKRPPLELDDLTNNLKQSSGKGIGVFFPSEPTPQEEKNLLFKNNKKNRIQRTARKKPSTQYPQYQ